MKSTICIIVVLLFLTPPMVTGDAAPEPVLDIAGKDLRTGVDYLILPLVKCGGSSTKCIDGGGLALSTTRRNNTCPLFVVDTNRALPLKFTPFEPKEGVVRVSTDLNIKFSAATTCVQSTVWKLQQFDGSSGQWFVTTGGVEGNPGRQTVSNWFEIEKYGTDYYKLVFCPQVCKFCKVLCKDLGIYVDGDGNRRLALSDVPYGVRFQKA